jgi:rhodanese-related sulfurtransferase
VSLTLFALITQAKDVVIDVHAPEEYAGGIEQARKLLTSP